MANKWIPLDSKKEPPSNKRLLITFDDGGWTEAVLRRIEFSGDLKTYVFGMDDNEWNDATHYMIIQTPKNNQQ